MGAHPYRLLTSFFRYTREVLGGSLIALIVVLWLAETFKDLLDTFQYYCIVALFVLSGIMLLLHILVITDPFPPS